MPTTTGINSVAKVTTMFTIGICGSESSVKISLPSRVSNRGVMRIAHRVELVVIMMLSGRSPLDKHVKIFDVVAAGTHPMSIAPMATGSACSGSSRNKNRMIRSYASSGLMPSCATQLMIRPHAGSRHLENRVG